MASTGQTNGAAAVHYVAAELSRMGFIVSVTARNARGADILVTDQTLRTAWTVQVKTNGKPMTFWLVENPAKAATSPTHLYVFVTLRGTNRPEYIVQPSEHVVAATRVKPSKNGNSIWFEFHRVDRLGEGEGWERFGLPHVAPELCGDGPPAEEASSQDQA
jgi:hypothetical protein